MKVMSLEIIINNFIIKTNPKFVRPAEVDLLINDSMKPREKLLWANLNII